ncbi:MAG TPA: GGDEF domain-containing protein [Candidatus Binatus sp.]|nr:GGDEF domain-containing protein [Candidatus Binatus sp.]
MRRFLASTVPSLTPRPLARAVAAQVVAAAIALLVVATTTPSTPDIALRWSGLQPALAPTAGLTFWLVFGLIGGVRTRLQPGGGVVTFSMPFIVAGAVLGGPLVGGLMGLVSELEVRELRTRPWYGILSNHAVGILAAICAGAVALAVRAVLEPRLVTDEALAFLAAVVAAALTFAVVNVALVIPTMAIKGDLSLREASRTPDVAFRATTAAEAILAWNLAVTYRSVGWWAPIAIVALVLVVWQAFDRGAELDRDRLTGLLNDRGFDRPFRKAIDAAKAGRRGAALLALDLDGLWEVNTRHGYEAGDVLLKVSAQRMLAAVRATDAVSRKANTGDEFFIVLDDIPDLESARRVAERIVVAVRQPIVLRGRTPVQTIQGGVSIGIVLIERGTAIEPSKLTELAEQRLLQAKVHGGGIVLRGHRPIARAMEAYARRKAERRSRQPASPSEARMAPDGTKRGESPTDT